MKTPLRLDDNPAMPDRALFSTSVHQAGEYLLPNVESVAEILEELEGPWHK
ncbi:MAG: hypothetical protein ABI824_20375 [Acidobacteriota bacterium]